MRGTAIVPLARSALRRLAGIAADRPDRLAIAVLTAVLILPAFSPTVARGTGLMRFAVSALHQQRDLETAARALGLNS